MCSFFWGGWGDWGGGKILKLVRITSETWNLVRKYTYVVSRNKPFSTKALLILLMSAFFVCKISVFLGENGILVFLGENTTRKLAINWKNNNNSQFADMTWSWFSFFFFFYIAQFLLLNLFTGSSFMTVSWLVLELWQFSFKKDWPEIRKLGSLSFFPVWVFTNILRLWRVRDTIVGTNISNKKLMNAEKCQGYSFHSFWVIKGKPAGEKGWGGVGKTNPHPD